MRSFFLAAAVGVAALGAIQLSGPAPAQAQQQTFPRLQALPPSSRDALTDWLQRDCSVGLTASITAGLIAIPGVDEAVLIEAYRQGPAPELERASTAAFDQAYQERNVTLAQEGAELLGAEDTARLLGVSRDDYVKRRLDDARLNYRTNAVHGLGAIGAEASLTLLAPIAADPADPLRSAAQAATETIRGRAKSSN
jgi:hypothetical protein